MSLDIPKSEILTVKLSPTRQFLVARSRCTKCCSARYFIPFAIWAEIQTNSSCSREKKEEITLIVCLGNPLLTFVRIPLLGTSSEPELKILDLGARDLRKSAKSPDPMYSKTMHGIVLSQPPATNRIWCLSGGPESRGEGENRTWKHSCLPYRETVDCNQAWESVRLIIRATSCARNQ